MNSAGAAESAKETGSPAEGRSSTEIGRADNLVNQADNHEHEASGADFLHDINEDQSFEDAYIDTEYEPSMLVTSPENQELQRSTRTIRPVVREGFI